ncbi:hypothetical protein B0H17DRAFT_1073148 [Mycena rosella]|uniref:Protein kinase domain-containing protein n=1 Tax=Mycena rosella TaxID=1033263 RepID=A0AAD7GAR1_MYCRO|nr:hypothetical protein B0H17DRAFT_1073148 [Mycena rosella]
MTRALAALRAETAELDGAATYEEQTKVEAVARGTAALAPYTSRSPASAELSKERDMAQASASKTDSTPVKSGGSTDMGINKLTRAHVEVHLAEELHSRRSKSSDLIECLFGSLVDISSGAEILRELLLMSILSVQKEVDGNWKDVRKEDFKAACTDAAIHANDAVTPSDSYRWKWGLPTQASEVAAALFFNVVAIAAHAASIRLANAPHHPPPSLRFVTLPNPQRAVPLSNESAAQDCRPDVVAFDLSAFCGAPTASSSNLLFPLDNSPFTYIRQVFPDVLRFTDGHKADKGPAIREFEKWFKEQERKTHLDMARFCWPEVELTAEAKLSDLPNAILQELVYMRQQRRTQPWMRSILGLVVTTKVVGVLRADTLGVEQCTFNRDCSRGVLDSIRICLGVVRSTTLQRGQHEAFELFRTRTLAPPHLKSSHGRSSKTKPSKPAVKSEVDVFSAEDHMVEYFHRTVRFITLRGNRLHYSQDGTGPDTRFYVHHLVQDSGSLVGRCARIFCVSRETESEGGVRNFIGPYALKLYNADCGSDCFKDDLIQLAREGQVKDVLLPTWEWYYGDALSARGFPPEIVKSYTDAQAAVPNGASNRQEVFAQSDLKRLLVQSDDYNEFVKAFIDFVEAIASLAKKDILHRDLSIGNVLLSKDIACSPSFLCDAAASVQAILGSSVAFTQRPLEQRIGGLIHDMDMAGRAHPPPKKTTGDFGSEADLLAALLKTNKQAEHPAPPAQLGGPRKGFRIGTPPFMAIRLLIGGPPHLAVYDLHSLLFVLVLFFWSYPKFLTDVPFPKPVPAQSRKWPLEVLQWANRPVGFSLAALGVLKRGFFQQPLTLRDTLERTLDGDLWTEDPAFLSFFWALYGALWTRSNEGQDLEWIDRFLVTAGEVQKVLTTEYVSQKEISDQ